MKNYLLFEETDFILDEDFIRWVKAKRPEDERFWADWLQENPGKYLIVARAKLSIESIAIRQAQISQDELQAQVESILQTVTQPVADQVRIIRSLSWIRIAAAVLIVSLTILAIFYFDGHPRSSYNYREVIAGKPMAEKVNNSNVPLSVGLPDGSRIELLPGSRISYAPEMSKLVTRDVYLYGEAFFSVTKDPSRPFRVFTNEIVTKVLGTSFTVRSFDTDRSIMVKVKTGKVSVSSQEVTPVKETALPNRLTGIILNPNQQVFYEKSKKTFEKELVSRPAVIAPKFSKSDMIFEDKPVVKVLEQIKSVYGISIFYDADVLQRCTITADLSNELLYRKLDLLCAAIEASYEIIDGQVFIQASSCN